MYRSAWLISAALLLLAGFITSTELAAAEERRLDSASIEVQRVEGEFAMRCAVYNETTRTLCGTLDVRITDLDGNGLLSKKQAVTIPTGSTRLSILLGGSVPDERAPLCVLKYQLTTDLGVESGAKGLMTVLAQLETRVVGYSNWLAGSSAALRLATFNHATGEPIRDAKVALTLTAPGNAAREVFTGVTNDAGTLDARFRVPDDLEGQTQMDIVVTAEGLGADHVSQPVTVSRKTKILLTTDKPVYQPGQLIHLRTLCLDVGDRTPEAKQPLVFEVMDSKGNKVCKHKVETDEYGVAATEFQLASEINLGSYIVRAILGPSQTEKQVTVDRYVLPKFKVDVKTDRDFYLPGQTVKGEVQSDYFFGKPTAGAKVLVVASKFEIQFEEFARVEGTLDPQGHWTFELPLPTYFAGTPIEQGKASVRVEVKVTDTADHIEEKVLMKPVAAAPIMVNAVPESGALIRGLENRVYVLASYPDGAPADGAEIEVSGRNLRIATPTVQADTLGIAVITVTFDGSSETSLHVAVRDKQGQSAERDIPLDQKFAAGGLILRTEKALYRVGDTLNAQVIADKPKGTVYFDLIREGQTVMTRAETLDGGAASLALDIDASLAGSVVLQAYMFTPSTDLIRDARLLYVNPADALTLAVQLDQESYRPGDKAQLRFSVTNPSGAPTPAALGVAIVDESVFALQEIHPGLEKIYFTLEKEIMKPRYEIHGYELEQMLIKPMSEERTGDAVPLDWSAEQQRAAQVLLASAPTPPEPPIRIDTFTQKLAEAQNTLRERCEKDLTHVQNAFTSYLNKYKDAPENLIDELLRKKYLRANELNDPWGNRYEVTYSQSPGVLYWLGLLSYGPDGVKGTPDDITVQYQGNVREQFPRRGVIDRFFDGVLGRPKVMMNEMAQVAADAAPQALPSLAAAPSPTGGVGEPVVRLRQYFPETLLFEPDLITDREGNATLEVALADSITTWRMTAMASSASGALGSKDTPLLVFQDFFVDLDLPVALTQHDRVSIPVVLYNYLKESQPVRLKFDEEPWFKLDGAAEQTVELAAGEVKAMYFPVEVLELGKHQLTVHAFGSKLNDAIRRQIEILPDGEEHNESYSDRLSGTVEQTVTIPQGAIPGASKILVRVFPGVYSQIVDGLDSMLQMPSGCFEQTSSSLYPNILIVQYMKATKQINPEIQMKAEGFINAGYQRLLAYEVAGGGYSWFGDAPANKILTAWGLKEFYDMSRVHEVDPAVIERTRKWLVGLQESDGSWKPDANYLHQESWGGIQKSSTLVTAYILDAILNSGAANAGPEVQKAIDYLRAHWQESDQAYVLALVSNALVSWNAKDAWTGQVLDKLYGLRVEDKDSAHWTAGADSVTFTHGDAADVEATALTAIAFLKAGKYPEVTTKALTYLIRTKSAQGHWGSTQATILALKALMESLGSKTEKVHATVTVALDGEQVSEFKITPDDSDVMRIVDLGDKTKPGANTVSLRLQGEGSMLYQIVGRSYLPWAAKPQPDEAMSIDVSYDKTQLAVNDIVTASVKVKNLRPNAAQMIVVDLGVPPGFQVMTPDLDELVAKGVMKKYELTGRQIIAYFEKIEGNATIEFGYRLQAKFPLRAQTPSSRVYEYYNPKIASVATPQAMVVE